MIKVYLSQFSAFGVPLTVECPLGVKCDSSGYDMKCYDGSDKTLRVLDADGNQVGIFLPGSWMAAVRADGDEG